jgi:hypothetical protein
MISNSLSVCHIISKAYYIRNFELTPVPACYRERIILNLDWIEFRASVVDAADKPKLTTGAAGSIRVITST